MAESGKLKGLIIGMILSMLFLFAMTNFMLEVSKNYDKEDDFLTEVLQYSEINDTLRALPYNESDLSSAFFSQETTEEEGVQKTSQTWGFGRNVQLFLTSPIRIFKQLLVDIFQVPSYVLIVIGFMIFILIVFAVWRLVRIGD